MSADTFIATDVFIATNVFVDTNVFVYGRDASEPDKQPEVPSGSGGCGSNAAGAPAFRCSASTT